MRIVKSRLVKGLFAQAWLVGLSAGAGHCWANAAVPIGLTGWNADVIYVPSGATQTVQSFDGSGYAWFEAGAYPTSGTYQRAGLSTAGDTQAFGSAWQDPNNTNQSEFEFQPYTGNNVLELGNTSDSGQTLTLTTPAGYNNLAILAASGNIGGDYQSTLTLTFSDGSTSSMTYDPYDWGQGTTQEVFSPNLSRMEDTSNGPTFGSASYNMYETDINLSNYVSSNGALDSAKFIKTITFAEPTSGRIGVFAVSGVQNSSAADPLPEPSTVALLAAAAVPLLLRQSARRRLAR
jgi:hypothetical protein